MKKYVVVSTNNNPDYYFYLPYIEKAWNKYGWDVCCMITDDVNADDLKYSNPKTVIIRLPKIEGLRTESIAQAGRLYAANYFDEDVFLMTSDIDLLPLSDYWKPNEQGITVYGHDLTDYSYIPMGYTFSSSVNWKSFMKLTGNAETDLKRDAEEYRHIAYAPNWESWWNFDWRMLTDRLKGFDITHIHRGRRLTGTFAYGRIDRGDSMQTPPNETLIDSHCENNNVQHPVKLNRFLEIFEGKYGRL